MVRAVVGWLDLPHTVNSSGLQLAAGTSITADGVMIMPYDVLKPHVRSIGDFDVRRLLPAAQHRMVGPFIFFDHMGPAELPPGHGMNVRPHPHIGLATVTYLFEGCGLHRDSLGTVQRIAPGDVNWMVAGRGIVHSERTPEEELKTGQRLHGIQTWVALPAAHEADDASFAHHRADTLPVIALDGGVILRLIAGEAFGQRAPTATFSPMFYVHAHLPAGASVCLEPQYAQRAVYAVDATINIDGVPLSPGHMAVVTARRAVTISSAQNATIMLLGGEKLDGDRIVNWNFVASDPSLIQRARESWTSYPNKQFAQVPDEMEWIPLPG